MSEGLSAVLIIIAVPLYILFFWNFVLSVMAMSKQSIVWGVLGVVLSPISQLLFRLSHGDKLSRSENKAFDLFYLSVFLFILFIATVFYLSYSTIYDRGGVKYSAANKYNAATKYSTGVEVVGEPTTVTSNQNQSFEKPQEVNYQRHLQIIFGSHPDAQILVDSVEFKSWLRSLSPDRYASYKRIMAKGTAAEVIYMLDQFKSFQQKQEYQNHIQYVEVQSVRPPMVESMEPKQDRRLAQRTAEQQIEANKKTMRVFRDAEALNKKRKLVKQGYSEPLAEEYIKAWKKQKYNSL